MKRRPSLVIVFLLVTAAAFAAPVAAPLLGMQWAKIGYENVIWAEQRAKIGDQSVTGYVQGLGGADDALIGFDLKEDWDMLECTIGFLSTAPEGRKAEFFVEAGGEVLYQSSELRSKGPSHQIRVPLKGHKKFVLRISAERYNDTAGAAWGEPMVVRGVSAEDLETQWNLEVNGHRAPLKGNGPPPEVMIPVPVPMEDGVFQVKVRRDPESRTVIVERTENQAE